MAHQNGGGADTVATGMMTPDGEAAAAFDGYGGADGERPFEERPELLVAAAFLAGVLIGGLVSRRGS
jgi:hypothetical protein